MNAIYASLVLLFALAPSVQAEVQSRVVEYQDGGVKLTGHLYWDDAIDGKRPGVLVMHEWWGLNDYVKQRARMLAERGFVAFAADMYGDNKVTDHARDAGGWMKQITANIDGWQQRALLGLGQLKADALVDADRLAAIGYCFGGATVMQLAYAGADLDGVVSFHGSLPPASAEQAARIKARILVAHGDADSFVPAERIHQFKQALTDAGVDWEMDIYGGARHAFTNPGADSHGMENLRYDPVADRRSWSRMQDFFAEIFTE